MPHATHLVTAEEFERWPDDGYRHELVKGRIVRMSRPGYRHGLIVGRVAFLLELHQQSRFGAIAPEAGVKLTTNPDTVRGPDVAFVRWDRMSSGIPRGFFNGAPDLAVEVVSPEDRPREVADKTAEYLRYGVRVVVVIDPDANTISAHRPQTPALLLNNPDDVLDLDDVVPGFRCTVRDILAP